jgi:hypothetical protein
MAPFIAFSVSDRNTAIKREQSNLLDLPSVSSIAISACKGTTFFADLQEKRQIFFIKSPYLTFADDKQEFR